MAHPDPDPPGCGIRAGCAAKGSGRCPWGSAAGPPPRGHSVPNTFKSDGKCRNPKIQPPRPPGDIPGPSSAAGHSEHKMARGHVAEMAHHQFPSKTKTLKFVRIFGAFPTFPRFCRSRPASPALPPLSLQSERSTPFCREGGSNFEILKKFPKTHSLSS